MDNKNMNVKEYFPFVDTAKGLGVFCVLMVHTLRFWVDMMDNFTTLIIKTFYMSLLFMASGYVYAKVWTRKVSFIDLFSFKAINILIPFFVLGISTILLNDYYITGTISRNPFDRLFFEVFNGGYWFLLTLFICRWIVIFTKYISQKLRIKQMCRQTYFVSFQILTCCVLGGAIVCVSTYYRIEIQLFNLCYFIFGILIYNFNWNKFLTKRYALLVTVICFIALFTFNYVCSVHYFGRSVFVTLFSTIAVWMILLRTGENIVVRFFRWVGCFSLDIYVLHTLFLIGTVGFIDDQWFISQPWIIQTFILVVGATLQLMCCYILSKVIRSDKMLTKCVLGR